MTSPTNTAQEETLAFASTAAVGRIDEIAATVEQLVERCRDRGRIAAAEQTNLGGVVYGSALVDVDHTIESVPSLETFVVSVVVTIELRPTL